MTGYEGFLKMQEIDKHLRQDAEWWRGEGLDPGSIATVLRAVAKSLDPVKEATPSWSEHWNAVRPRSFRAP